MKTLFIVCGFMIFQSIYLARAESIYIDNSSFEDPVLFVKGIPPYQSTNDLSVFLGASAPKGERALRLRQGGFAGYSEGPVNMLTSHNLISNSLYVLQIDVGQVSVFGGIIMPRAELWAGSTMLNSEYLYDTSSFMTTGFTYYSPSNHPAIGSPLEVRLSFEWLWRDPYVFDGGGEAYFDNLRLTRYVNDPTMSIEAVNSSNIVLGISELETNLVYRLDIIDELPLAEQTILSSSLISSSETTTNLSMPLIGNQGFIKMEPFVVHK